LLFKSICFGLVFMLAGCSSTPRWLPTSGPSNSDVQAENKNAHSPIRVLDINNKLAMQLGMQDDIDLFSQKFKTAPHHQNTIGAGDVIEVSVWEAPPAMLFTSGAIDAQTGTSSSKITTFPSQMVEDKGMISIPFAGKIRAKGRSPSELETAIKQRLKNKANQPQVLVRVINNNTANVTLVGDVMKSISMPLTPKGERLLDALATAGGVRQAINKTTIQVTRGNTVYAMPLGSIIKDPRQNITLLPGDVVTALSDPLSFTVLGAAGKNEQVHFETEGISLAEALGRAGGLEDSRADAGGVFIFRFEKARALEGVLPSKAVLPVTSDERVPVVYRADMKNPVTFFAAQNFMMRNKDIMYVSNASAAELQKFLTLLTLTFYPIQSAVSISTP
jgi:polysaccharide biosynthesis/export protein